MMAMNIVLGLCCLFNYFLLRFITILGYLIARQLQKGRTRMSLQLNIDYPETLPDAIGQTREQFEQEAKWAMAIKLFEMKRLSSGQAAALVGTDRVSFLLNLHRYGVAMIEESEEELLSDLENA